MGEVERPQQDDKDAYGRLRIPRRGHQMQMSLAKIEAMSGLVAVDRLLVLNQALTNVLHDASGGR